LKSRKPSAALLAVGLGLPALACGTTYQPRSSPRVGLVVHHGSVVYVQNGRETPIGALGGDLPGLVAATPAAAAHARKARTELGVGVPSYVVGLGGVAVGLTILSGPIGWVVVGVGACLGGTGLGFMGAGVTNALDAVNIHNDHVGGEADSGAAPAGGPAARTEDGAGSRR
jgi:hypothetical protein